MWGLCAYGNSVFLPLSPFLFFWPDVLLSQPDFEFTSATTEAKYFHSAVTVRNSSTINNWQLNYEVETHVSYVMRSTDKRLKSVYNQGSFVKKLIAGSQSTGIKNISDCISPLKHTSSSPSSRVIAASTPVEMGFPVTIPTSECSKKRRESLV